MVHDCAKIAGPRAGELRNEAKVKQFPLSSLLNIIWQLSPFIQILELLALPPFTAFNSSRHAKRQDIDLPRMNHLKEVDQLLQRA